LHFAPPYRVGAYANHYLKRMWQSSSGTVVYLEPLRQQYQGQQDYHHCGRLPGG